MKKLLLLVGCLVFFASPAYGQKETIDEFVERGMREYRQNELERERLRMERAREEREEEMARSQRRINMLLEDRLSRPQQYQIRRNGNSLIIEEY